MASMGPCVFVLGGLGAEFMKEDPMSVHVLDTSLYFTHLCFCMLLTLGSFYRLVRDSISTEVIKYPSSGKPLQSTVPNGTNNTRGLETMAEPEDELAIATTLESLDAPACTSLIRRTFSPPEVISLIEAIFTSKDEVKMLRNLRGDDAQTFVNVISEVRPALFPFSGTVLSLVFLCSLASELSPSADQALDLPDLQPHIRGKCLGALFLVSLRTEPSRSEHELI